MSIWTVLAVIVTLTIVIPLVYKRFDKAALNHTERTAKHRNVYPPDPYDK